MANLPTAVTIEYDRLVSADDWEGVRILLAPLLKSGHAEALYLCAMASQPGESEEEFHARHVESVRVAAESGYAPAMFTQGMYHLFGDMAPLDKESAARNFAAAARQGYPAAQYEYGLALLHGVGIPTDPLEGRRLIHAAAAAGNEYAQEFTRAERGDGSSADGKEQAG
jgi:TPR repeat protein